jgi:heptaprenyl diphosphate synthase
MLAATAAMIQILESPLPRLLPWLKPGLSNSIVLFGIIRVSPWFGVQVVLLRSLLTGVFLGTLFSPVNILAFAGGISSALVMGGTHRFGRKLVSVYGISILGALTHNFAQLSTISTVFGTGVPIPFHLAIMIWIAIPSGIIVAKITTELLERIP